ncbi:type II secretion system protein [Polaromonas sp. YR568]|uniref:type II secretion system protein n=1 Tax=Polaromonas sp. YR568 TaxID=1855301 RepID=UPI00398BF939
MKRSGHPRKHLVHLSGLVLLAVLIFMLLTTLSASAMVELQRTHTQRAKEAELLFVGDQFRRAIKSYYSSVPAGKSQTLPRSLNDLLEDTRFPMPVRHLRRVYPDPMTGEADWVPVQGAGGIMGVHSRSTLSAFKKREFPVQYRDFQDKETYAEWVFVASLN